MLASKQVSSQPNFKAENHTCQAQQLISSSIPRRAFGH
jgi:hypothetical protein